MKTALKWTFGVICVFIGFIAPMVSISGGILFLIAGAFLIPPSFNKIYSNLKVSHTSKILIPIFAALIGLILIGKSQSDDKRKVMKNDEDENIAHSVLSPMQKDSIAEVVRISDSLQFVQKQREAELRREKEIQHQKDNTVTASQLYAAYEANEVNADEHYKNKVFYVTGIVDGIQKDFLDNIYVTLSTGQMFASVHCDFNDKIIASQLRKGQRVTFNGTCSGMMVTIVTMDDCTIVDNL